MVRVTKVIYVFPDDTRKVENLVNVSVSSKTKLSLLRESLRKAMRAKHVHFQYEEH